MNKAYDTISVIGLGYIGLPTAAMLASRKIKVIGVDINQHAVDTVNKGGVHIIEPELDTIVNAAVSQGFLRATTKPEPADAFLIAVPTPFRGEHEPDIGFVEAAVGSIAPVLKKGDLVILESTSPVGTTEKVAQWLSEARPDLAFPQQRCDSADVNIAYCPERVLPGRVVYELINNNRIIGGITPQCSQRAIDLYKTFVVAECIETDARTAEMCKLTENSFRDVNIAFANELSIICERLNIDVWALIKLANRHPRVSILQPGPGVGGHCIAVDPWFIVSRTPVEARLIRAAREVNDSKPRWVLDRVRRVVAEYLQENPDRATKGITIACFGLAFKPDIDDLRESPSLEISIALANEYPGRVVVIEPNVFGSPASLPGGTKMVTPSEAQKISDIAVLLVAHKEFKSLPRSFWRDFKVIDACGLISADW
jgi:UDP-N-acetyl-D-mannosaminuronic acid dehydrogenase